MRDANYSIERGAEWLDQAITRRAAPTVEAGQPPAHNRMGVRPGGSDLALPDGEAALALLEREMTPISYLCDPWIPEGLHLIASRPKLGKSTLLRQELAAVAGGTELFGVHCRQATTAYLSLEEGDRLARRKFEIAGFSDEALASILVHFNWRRGAEGIDDLRRMHDRNANIRYIGIDSLTRFRSV